MGRKKGKVKTDEEKKESRRAYKYNKAAYSAQQLKRYYVERSKRDDMETVYNNDDYYTDNFIYNAF